MASHLRCHLAYVSQVLSANAHFSAEQADSLNSFLGHGEEASDFFLLLVQRGRAGTRSLQTYYDRKIQKELDRRLVLKNRLTDKKTISREDQATYYSAWYYAAIHMGVLIPELRTAHALAHYFGISTERTANALLFLASIGLVREVKGKILPGETRIHLESDSPMISKHHTNWRIQAIESLERESFEALHYSSLIAVSQDDAPQIREILVKAIEQVRDVVKNSQNENAIYCYALDFFGLGSETRDDE